MLTIDELRLIWHACGGLLDYGRIVRLLILTGQRKNEIGGLTWAEISGSEVHLPAERVKNHRSHIVPLVPLALAQLPPRRDGFVHLFGRRPGKGFSGWSKAKALLDSQVCEMTPWTVHDLRRTFVTMANEKDLAPPHVIEAAVNHISGHKTGVAGIYNRAAYLAKRRALMDRWAQEVQRIVGLAGPS